MNRGPAASDGSEPKLRDAFQTACRYLTARERCAAQVRTYLERHAFSADEITEAIRNLQEKRFVDDFRYARAYVEMRSRRAPRAGRWLVRELIARGIDRETAQRAVDDFLREIPEEALARRLLARMGGRGRADVVQRAALKLRSRGFHAAIAIAWAREEGIEAGASRVFGSSGASGAGREAEEAEEREEAEGREDEDATAAGADAGMRRQDEDSEE
jgi:SOS response regulatory protein OraA/RecX